MILFSVGLSSRFARWCEAVVERLARQSGRAIAIIEANTIEELAVAAIGAKAPCLLAICRQPTAKLRTTILQANGRAVVALDDPVAPLRELNVLCGIEVVDAVRAVANSCAAVAECISMPGALVLPVEQRRGDPVGTANAIARHFEIDASPDQIVAAIADIAADDGYDEDAAWWEQLEENTLAVAKGALGAYRSHFCGGDFRQITWERDLFAINEETVQARATRSVDITGRPRCLVYGPYIALPPGEWSATVTLGFSKEAAEQSYIVEVFADAQMAHVRVAPGNNEFVEARVNFSIDPSFEGWVQVRVQNERAAFDGRLALGRVVLARHAQIHEEIQRYFVEALGAHQSLTTHPPPRDNRSTRFGGIF